LTNSTFYEQKTSQKGTSLTEIIHILIGTILVALVIGSLFFNPVDLFANFPMNLERISLFGLLSLMAAPAFILHELTLQEQSGGMNSFNSNVIVDMAFSNK